MTNFVNFIEDEAEIVYHPKSCYISRKINYSAKLNEILAQDELSSKIIIMNDDQDGISKNLGMYKNYFYHHICTSKIY